MNFTPVAIARHQTIEFINRVPSWWELLKLQWDYDAESALSRIVRVSRCKRAASCRRTDQISILFPELNGKNPSKSSQRPPRRTRPGDRPALPLHPHRPCEPNHLLESIQTLPSFVNAPIRQFRFIHVSLSKNLSPPNPPPTPPPWRKALFTFCTTGSARLIIIVEI